MATNHIPKNSNLLAAYMERILLGDDHHKSERALPLQIRGPLVSARQRLVRTNTRLHNAEAELAAARKALRDDKEGATNATRRARDGVYGLWGEKNPILIDYGLRPSRRGRPRRR